MIGESEVRAAWLRKSEYLCETGDREGAVSAFRRTFEKTVGIGNRIDLVFHQIRLGLFYMDHQLITANLSKAHHLMEQVSSQQRKQKMNASQKIVKLASFDETAGRKSEIN